MAFYILKTKGENTKRMYDLKKRIDGRLKVLGIILGLSSAVITMVLLNM